MPQWRALDWKRGRPPRGETISDNVYIELTCQDQACAEQPLLRGKLLKKLASAFGSNFEAKRKRSQLLQELSWHGIVMVLAQLMLRRWWALWEVLERATEEEAMEEAIVVQQMDEDHDGKINWEEMKNYFTTLFEPFPTHVFDQVVTAMLAATKEKPYQGCLDGFPSTPSQARALEYALTGYREVNEEAVCRRQNREFTHMLAQPPPEKPRDPTALYGKSGITCALMIDINNETVIRRAMGRVDLWTMPYHIEYNMPSMNEPNKWRLKMTDDMMDWRSSLPHRCLSLTSNQTT